MAAAGRLARQEMLEADIARWSAERTQDEVEALCIGARIPCHRLSRSADLFNDPQLIHRGHFVTVDHPVLGPIPLESSRMRFGRTPAATARPGPTLGQDTERILREILGLHDDDLVELFASGALE